MMSIASKYIAIVFPFILLVFYFIQRFYLRTSRQMRFLDIEHKAPLYSQMMETLSGLLSIRAFGWQEGAYTTNWRLLDDSQRPNYLLYCLQRWLTLSVDLVIALLAVIMIIVTTTLREQIGPGYMGVALTNVLAFGSTLKAALTSWVSLEISIGAVARIKNFASRTEPEGGVNEVLDRPGTGWPSHGSIQITNLSASYP
jgi:ATP-binding cassette, subfamily C (CFTR/MRP), member 1